MTSSRLVLLAFAALLATAGAFWLSSQRHLDRAVNVSDPVLPQLRTALNDVAELRLSRGDGAVVTLQRGESGWSVGERRWPADAGKLRKLLLDLSQLAIVEEKTHDAARYAVLGVEDVDGPQAGGVRIDVKTSHGAIHSLIIGKTSGARGVYVRAVGAEPSYLASPQVTTDTAPVRWLDTTLLDVPAEDIRTVTLLPRGRPARTLEGAQLPPDLAAALVHLALEDVRAAALEPATPPGKTTDTAVPRLRFTSWDGRIIELEGREDGTRRWIRIAASFDSSAARPRPDTSADDAKDEDATSPAAPTPASITPTADPREQIVTLARRTDGREFEIPAYRYATLFNNPVAR
ncbi:MAG: DUF4340 domain-containing protein [Sinobacteraceae bacterium]|nr:DUF4340 domain-containing protein [Nevskiaceae bacterium]MCP5359531.1 DUF4340 domain-containing protein [Nevskiaceae bacterium]MCP5467479.1 DUF4340 domain-containing protein [Nevskiaceae bacterium]MCP5471964.1 DUF4340 domain-containing protein [Nevskiaceae bacterium]